MKPSAQKRSKSKSSLGYDQNTRKIADDGGAQCTEVHFTSLLSGGFTTMAVINPPESKLEKRTSVDWLFVLGLSTESATKRITGPSESLKIRGCR